LPSLAVMGLVLAMFAVRASSQQVEPAEPVSPPARAPFASYIAGAGIVEASTENIAIGTQVPGVVTEVNVAVGQQVRRGMPLFTIDTRADEAELRVRLAAMEQARQQLERLRNQPRPEDLPPLEARVLEAEANLADRHRERARLSAIPGEAISRDERERAELQVSIAEAQLVAARAELNRAKAGAWAPDVRIAEAQLAAAAAQVASKRVDIERLTVRAPVDATVLQVKTRVGEYASAGMAATPLMLLGDVDTLHVRVDVDENDAWRLRPGATARAFLRGNSELSADLRFIRIEPYVIPKRNLSGESTERVDTRVLQVIFAFERSALPAYVGQQMDVFIEATPPH
ncbi:MAG TPA: HlyD family efflux transporter periplasmic adaptor subunit, partial [Tepidisphaeraceae bacterium]|nr:HlyD family efflux transporter periplasmic adaptor subunit [Tepidisphaeraceae bacterium]